MLSIVLTEEEHKAFINVWRSKIGYKNDKQSLTTINASRNDIEKAAKEIYKDYPEILKVLNIE